MIQTKDKRPKTKDLIDIEITCRQHPAQINFKNIRIILREILRLLGLKSFCISVVFCDNKFISKLNRKFFKKSRATDVISFPLQDDAATKYLGEIVISVEQAKRMCDFYGKKWREELALYLIHGILHLVGYNDIKKKERAVMERKQEEILSKILKKHKKIVDNIGK
jgi:probable rRNA maturation factor